MASPIAAANMGSAVYDILSISAPSSKAAESFLKKGHKRRWGTVKAAAVKTLMTATEKTAANFAVNCASRTFSRPKL